MNKKVNSPGCIRCNICNKKYSSKSSLCNHNKKFHNLNIKNVNNVNTDVNTNVNNVNTDVNTTVIMDISEIKCINCNKVFTSRQAKSLHLKNYCKKVANKK
jgi:ribosomal protein S13